MSHYKSTTRRKKDFLPIKTKNIFFNKFDKPWIRDPDPGSGILIRIEILGWIRIRIRIKWMRIRNTALYSKDYNVDTVSGCGENLMVRNFSLPKYCKRLKRQKQGWKNFGSNNCRPSDTELKLFWNFFPIYFMFIFTSRYFFGEITNIIKQLWKGSHANYHT